MPGTGPSVRRRPSAGLSVPAVAGVVALALVAVLYPLVASATQQPLAIFLLPAAIVALFGSWRRTALVGVAALVLATTEGLAVGGLTAAGLAARLGTMTLALVVATAVTAQRERRDRALRAALPQLAAALRTTRALHAGVIGTWHWNRHTGAVEWDDDLHELFGLRPGTFEGTFDAWVARLHPDDRARVVRAVADGVDDRGVFTFDHRCIWPNGEVHWLQGVGEVVLDQTDPAEAPADRALPAPAVIGASGVALNIDERIALLENERRHRDRLLFLARTNRALVETLDVGEVVDTVAAAAVPELADWCAIAITVDRPPDAPLLSFATQELARAVTARRRARTVPWCADAAGGLAAVIRTATAEFEPELTVDRVAAVAPPAVLAVLGSVDHDGTVIDELRSSITVPLRGPLGVLGALQLLRTSARPPFGPLDVELVTDLADTIGSALTNAVLSRRQDVAHAALASLQRLTASLVEATTTAEVAASVVGTGSAALHASRGALYLCTEGGGLLRAQTGRPELLGTTPDEPDEEVAAEAVRTGSPVLRAGCTVAAVPLRFGGRVLGALVFGWDAPHDLDAPGRELLFQIAGRCSGALERARLFEHQHSVATTLQRSLLPSRLVAPPWLHLAASYQSAERGTDVGGDFYDVVELDAGSCLLLIGDVCGKGVEAATLTAVARHTARATVPFTSEPEDVLRAVHHAVRDADRASYITVAAVRLVQTASGAVAEVALGGHPPPRLRRVDGTVERLGGAGTLLGMFEPSLCTRRYRLGHGDAILLFTDGVTDAPGAAGIEPDELDTVLRCAGGAPQQLVDAVVAAVDRRRRGDTADDVALLAAGVR